jgi:hypothetical protein
VTDDTDHIPWDVHAKLEDPMGVLAIALAQWEVRPEEKAQPYARRAAGKALDEIGTMLGELNAMRTRLVNEIRAYDLRWEDGNDD